MVVGLFAETGLTEGPSYGWYLVEMVLVLAGVCFLAWLSLRYLGRRAYGPRAKGPIQILARTPLEPRLTLYIVEVGGKCLLLGSGEGPIAVLGELDARKVRAELATQESQRGQVIRSFLQVLHGKKAAPASKPVPEPVPAPVPDSASDPSAPPAAANPKVDP